MKFEKELYFWFVKEREKINEKVVDNIIQKVEVK